MSQFIEPKEAFPYKPPTEEIKQKYRHIFDLKEPLPARFFKTAFDKLVGLIMLIISAPILLLLKMAYVIEGWLIPENAGPMFFYYWGVSAGKQIPKYKIRLIKQKYIEPEGAKRHDWIAFSAEWTPENRTHIGEFVKKFYLDELPQFWSVLKGDMSIVGPRPTVPSQVERYDATQRRRLLARPGVTGLAQVRGRASIPWSARIALDVDYVDNWRMARDLRILLETVRVVVRGEGSYRGESGGFDLSERTGG